MVLEISPDLAALSEARLIEGALAADQQLFAELMRRYAGAVHATAYRMLGNAQDAEDAAQEIFLRAYTNLAAYDRGRKFSTWLLAIASNYCIDRLRRRRLTWLTLDDIAPMVPSDDRAPDEHILQRETQDTVQRALATLPENYRSVTVLRYWNDLSYEEIADVTRLPISTIKTRLHRARRMLGAVLGIMTEDPHDNQ